MLRLLRGEDLDPPAADELGVSGAVLAAWREKALAGGRAALKNRPEDDRDEEIGRLRTKAGEVTMGPPQAD